MGVLSEVRFIIETPSSYSTFALLGFNLPPPEGNLEC